MSEKLPPYLPTHSPNPDGKRLPSSTSKEPASGRPASRLPLLLLFAIALVVVYPLREIPSELYNRHWRSNGLGGCHGGEKGGKGSELDRWIDRERRVAWDGMLGNIGPVAGASPGLVIASPSTSSPDYFYTWTRDSAITFLSILDRFLPSDNSFAPSHHRALDHGLESLVREYVASQAKLQMVDNPSGGFGTGGLGEPKFEVNGTAFKGSWGRPQNDGPPLRALVLIRYCNYLLDRSPSDLSWILSNVYNPNAIMSPRSVLKNDLEYVAHRWQEESFDLWEEISATHFFTLLVSHRALTQGAALALRLSDPAASAYYALQASLISAKLELFWLPSPSSFLSTIDRALSGYIISTLDSPARFNRTGLDSGVLLAILKAGGEGEKGSWSVAGEKVLATVERYVRSFEGVYGINHEKNEEKWGGAIAVGRYAEDIYDGVGTSRANPWYICTFTVAEIYYKILSHFYRTGSITPTPISLPFWRSLDASVQPNTTYYSSSLHHPKLSPTTAVVPYSLSSWFNALFLEEEETVTSIHDLDVAGGKQPNTYQHVMATLLARADGFLEIGKKFEGPGGTLTEQFDRITGHPTGARNLTWSYGSFLDATNARRAYLDLLSQHPSSSFA